MKKHAMITGRGPSRLIAMGIATLVVLVVLAGCGGGNESNDAPSHHGARDERVLAPNVFETTAANQAHTFRNLDQIENTRIIEKKGTPFVLEKSPFSGELGEMTLEFRDYMRAHRVAGLLILRDGKIAYEAYGMGNDATSKWTNFSVAKSFVGTLAGAAVRDKKLDLHKQASEYLPKLAGSQYGNATVLDLLTMTTGVTWEDTVDGNLGPLLKAARRHKRGAVLDYLSTLPKDWSLSQSFTFNYDSGGSHVLGEVIQAATGKPLNKYLSEKIWGPAGMESDGYWWSETKDQGIEYGGGNISATLRDFGRFGHFILTGAMDRGRSILPATWAQNAYKPPLFRGTDYGMRNLPANTGYGYQWWIVSPFVSHRSEELPIFYANGIFGQYIFIDRQTRTVAVVLSAWREPYEPATEEATFNILLKAMGRMR